MQLVKNKQAVVKGRMNLFMLKIRIGLKVLLEIGVKECSEVVTAVIYLDIRNLIGA